MVYQASLSGLIRIVFYFFLFSFIIRLVAHLAAPLVVKKAQEALRNQASRQQPGSHEHRTPGEVTVEKNTKNTTHNAAGEFVDFVEIKDDK